jgi:hypothetical protein
VDAVLPGERFVRGDDCYAVESHVAEGVVEIRLVHYRRQHDRRLHADWSAVDTLAAQRFRATDMNGYWGYSSQVEQAARHALDGELGCYVDSRETHEGFVRIRLVERRLHDLLLVTEILEERRFDASELGAAAASAAYAEELRQRANRLNDLAGSARGADAAATEVENAEQAAILRDRAREAHDLAQILRDRRP